MIGIALFKGRSRNPAWARKDQAMPKSKKIKETDSATAVAFVLLRLPQVKARTGLRRSELYRRIGNP